MAAGFTTNPTRSEQLLFLTDDQLRQGNELIDLLGVTKQSLNRVLRQLVDDGLVESRVGVEDRRHRNLHLTEAGQALEHELSAAQRRRMRAAFSNAGPEAVAGFRKVLEQMIDPELRARVIGWLDRP